MWSTKIIDNQRVWENFVLASPQASFLQSWNWGEFHRKLGHKVFRLGLFQGEKLAGVGQLIKISAKRATYCECPGGPIIDWENHSAVTSFFAAIRTVARQEKTVFVRIRPNVLKTPASLAQLKQVGLIKAPMHLHAETTWVLDLSPSAAELLQAMRKTTRYSIKKALQLGVEVVQSVAEEDVQTLFNLQLQVAQRRHFAPFSQRYLLTQFQTFKADNQIQLFKVSYKGKVLAIAFILFYAQEAVYHYAGSSDEVKFIPASFALQWQAILEAKRRGLSRYNFWGIANTDNPRHRFAGVTLFKKGFGGYRVDYLPAHDLVIKANYWLVYFFETLRRKLRRL